MAGWGVGSGTGVRPLRTGTAWIGLLDRTMIPDFPIPDSGFPNSEFRMAYGGSGIPHHEIAGLGGAHEGHMSRDPGRV